MNIFVKLCLLSLALFLRSALADVPLFKIPTSSAQTFSGSVSASSASGSYLIVQDGTNSRMRILKRNELSGVFYLRWVESQYCASVTTDGVWFACARLNDLLVFTFDEVASNYGTSISLTGAYANVQLMSDGTLVALNSDRVVTYKFSSNTWTMVNTTTISALKYPFTGLLMHLTDTSLAYSDGTSARLLQRNPDYSWTLLEQVDLSPVALSLYSLLWINDTLVVSYIFDMPPSSYSTLLRVYVKTNNAWNVTLETSGQGLIDPSGALGSSLVKLSDTQVIVGASNDGQLANGNFGTGSILSLDRGTDMQWQFTARVQDTARDGLWAMSVISSDQELIVWRCVEIRTVYPDMSSFIDSTCGPTVVPLCFKDPVNVTCHDQHFNACSNITNVNTNDLFTVHNPGCGVALASSRTSLRNNGLEISFDFNRFGAPVTGSCTATLTCPAQASSPDQSNGVPPSQAIMPVSGPIEVNVPVTITPAESKVSVARTLLEFSALSAITAILFTTLM
eukprot:TRINITY_DN3870_c0_g1_i2.p1 TRINITY_DN3870_c0_g1~~TRINITY_DN3870_c0_g1_i2.p1  ORF type:complete len:508 (+),score=25.36 TRINITY_DN3870_c0_g1_i2:1357-2880(+)